ncbi:Hypothetical predicted protein [Mytilus galloprovincialis]|uniref:TIR domain-containing protein n=1 Tax=Mytilus galloprovincialis TaxID=29158 RepID=A0A8B6C9E1_MYTGA|nr:Hypothetical predicted protein [Mytilus galloprovincialis]
MFKYQEQIRIMLVLLFKLVQFVNAKCKIQIEKEYKSAFCWHQGLSSVPQNLPVDINRLDLRWNNLTTIQNYAFARYTVLKHLYIRDNKLRSLMIYSFCGVQNLQLLALSGNKLDVSVYPYGVFRPIENLEYLDASRNMKNGKTDEVVYSLAFNHLVHLRELHVDLVSRPNLSKSFMGMNSLQKLWFDYCYIYYISNETFTSLPKNITDLGMQNCKSFFTIESNALQHFPNLNVLDLSGSHIHLQQALRSLYPLQNYRMKEINFHHLTYSSITRYDYDVILSQEMMRYIATICVQTLDISFNNIVAIREMSLIMFQHPECFVNVILSANRFGIEQMDIEFLAFFYKMTNLKLFDFSYLPLEFKNPVFPNILYGSPQNNIEERIPAIKKIKTLFLPEQLNRLRLTHFMANINIDEIRAVNCSLAVIDLSYFQSKVFPKFIFENNHYISELDLSGISAFNTKSKFPQLNALLALRMRKTELCRLIDTDTHIFSWAPKMQELDISSNFIWYLKENSLGDLSNLYTLNMSNNILQYFPTSLTKLENIRVLDLSFNRIITLDEHTRGWIDSQQIKRNFFQLYLTGNSFICSCETKEFLTWLFNTKAELDNEGNYSCRLSNGQTNFTINVYNDFHNYFANCESQIWLKIGVALMTSLCTAVACVTLIYNFRWRMIFFFHKSFRRRAEEVLKINFVYDVYVSYSDDSTSFVKKVLQPIIEHKWGLTMCCEDRDFIVGESNADVRATSIHQSRHIIFLVTPAFIGREWSSFEIERAKYEKISNKLQKIIMITKNISFRHIPLEFRAIWKDIYLIDWPIEIDGQETAWKKLRLWFL